MYNCTIQICKHRKNRTISSQKSEILKLKESNNLKESKLKRYESTIRSLQTEKGSIQTMQHQMTELCDKNKAKDLELKQLRTIDNIINICHCTELYL